MNRRAFGMTVLGVAAATRSARAQAPSWSRFTPSPGSLKERMHSGQEIRSAAAPVESTRSELQEIIEQRGGADLFTLDSGEFRHGETPPTDRLQYAGWWNGHALLGFQIETLRAALNVRNIVKPGVDWISWGPGDMAFDIERHSDSPFRNLEEVHGFVTDQLQGYDVPLPGYGSLLFRRDQRSTARPSRLVRKLSIACCARSIGRLPNRINRFLARQVEYAGS